jgi:branched-chain amino acid transport system ATP-binding protein
MDVVRELADRIVVLHTGKLVADGEPEAVIASPIVQEAYLGLSPEMRIAQDGAPSPRPSSAGREREGAA